MQERIRIIDARPPRTPPRILGVPEGEEVVDMLYLKRLGMKGEVEVTLKTE